MVKKLAQKPKNKCFPNRNKSRLLGKGDYAETYLLCASNGVCDSVAKIGKINKNEFIATKLASDYKVGPKLISHELCKSGAKNIVVMEKMDYTLSNMMHFYSAKFIFNSIKRLHNKLKKRGIQHNDFHLENIMFKNGQALAIDWGFAYYKEIYGSYKKYMQEFNEYDLIPSFYDPDYDMVRLYYDMLQVKETPADLLQLMENYVKKCSKKTKQFFKINI